ncbi:helix-turn-helix transcriptional regulator [Chloroflexota bacterium]
MPIIINGNTYYRTSEVYRIVGISRSTFFRWLRKGTFKDAHNVDRRGWRVFTGDELAELKAEANQIKPKVPKTG